MYKELFINEVYENILENYLKIGDFPAMKIYCRSIIHAINQLTVPTLFPSALQKYINGCKITEYDPLLDCFFLKEMLQLNPIRCNTIFEVLLMFYMHWVFYDPKTKTMEKKGKRSQFYVLRYIFTFFQICTYFFFCC